MANPRSNISYKRLDVSKNEFRLLELRSANDIDDRVECRLITQSLTEDVEFLAISALYGDQKVEEIIFVNGHRVPVPQNLAQAIRHVRAVFLSPQSFTFPSSTYSSARSTSSINLRPEAERGRLAPSKSKSQLRVPQTSPAPRWLKHALRHVRSILPKAPGQYKDAKPPRLLIWLDAICVNQQDAAETKDSRAVMRQIYGQAKTVIGWLGMPLEDGTTDLAMDSMKQVDEAIPPNWGDAEDQELHPENYSPQHEWMKKIAHFWEGGYDEAIAAYPSLIEAHTKDDSRVPDPEDLQKNMNGSVTPPKYKYRNSAWASVCHILERDYFQRQWILDELAMAKFPTFLIGDRILSWKHILRLNRLIEEMRDSESDVFPAELKPMCHDFPLGIVYTLLSDFEKRQNEEKLGQVDSTSSSNRTGATLGSGDKTRTASMTHTKKET